MVEHVTMKVELIIVFVLKVTMEATVKIAITSVHLCHARMEPSAVTKAMTMNVHV